MWCYIKWEKKGNRIVMNMTISGHAGVNLLISATDAFRPTWKGQHPTPCCQALVPLVSTHPPSHVTFCFLFINVYILYCFFHYTQSLHELIHKATICIQNLYFFMKCFHYKFWTGIHCPHEMFMFMFLTLTALRKIHRDLGLARSLWGHHWFSTSTNGWPSMTYPDLL